MDRKKNCKKGEKKKTIRERDVMKGKLKKIKEGKKNN